MGILERFSLEGRAALVTGAGQWSVLLLPGRGARYILGENALRDLTTVLS